MALSQTLPVTMGLDGMPLSIDTQYMAPMDLYDSIWGGACLPINTVLC